MFFAILAFFRGIVRLLLWCLELCMLARAVMSWIMPEEDNGLTRFLYGVTEPFISPVRKFLLRFPKLSSLPIDISFMITWMLLAIISMFL